MTEQLESTAEPAAELTSAIALIDAASEVKRPDWSVAANDFVEGIEAEAKADVKAFFNKNDGSNRARSALGDREAGRAAHAASALRAGVTKINRKGKPMSATSAPPPSPPVKPVERLKTNRMTEESFGWRTYEATVTADTPVERLLQGDFWRLNAHRIRRGDHIQWRDDPLLRFGELVVIAIDVATANMELRSLWSAEVAPSSVQETERCGFTPKDFGVHERWGVVRDCDGQVVAKDIASRDEAMRRIRIEFVPNMALQTRQEAKLGL